MHESVLSKALEQRSCQSFNAGFMVIISFLPIVIREHTLAVPEVSLPGPCPVLLGSRTGWGLQAGRSSGVRPGAVLHQHVGEVIQ